MLRIKKSFTFKINYQKKKSFLSSTQDKYFEDWFLNVYKLYFKFISIFFIT